MSKIWITSDTHFNHANIIKYCNRPFASVEEMNERLLKNINDCVGPEDVLYHLGDLTFGQNKAYDILKQINCKNIKLCMGNHDNRMELESILGGQNIFDIIELKGQFGKVVMCHYPFASWNGKNHNSVMLHGHTHNTLNNDSCYRLDCGVDNTNYAPILLNDAIRLAKMNKPTAAYP